MLLYRSIGMNELSVLLSENGTVCGKYNCLTEAQTTYEGEEVVCFFTEPIFWKDSRHKFFIEVEIPEDELEFGIGTYYASAVLAKTHIWTGRRGNTTYKFKEAYAKQYSISQIKRICLHDYFAKSFLEKYIMPQINKYNITTVSDLRNINQN